MNWLTLSPEWLHDQEEHADSLGSAGSQLEASYHTILWPFFLCSGSQLLELCRQKSNSTVLICLKNSNSDWEAETVQGWEGAALNRASQLMGPHCSRVVLDIQAVPYCGTWRFSLAAGVGVPPNQVIIQVFEFSCPRSYCPVLLLPCTHTDILVVYLRTCSCVQAMANRLCDHVRHWIIFGWGNSSITSLST